jgi:hypothetical protein
VTNLTVGGVNANDTNIFTANHSAAIEDQMFGSAVGPSTVLIQNNEISGTLLAADPLAIGQGILLDLHGTNTLHYQPVKLAAIEGIWDTGPGQGG